MVSATACQRCYPTPTIAECERPSPTLTSRVGAGIIIIVGARVTLALAAHTCETGGAMRLTVSLRPPHCLGSLRLRHRQS
jgi:hypothetical protein